jgi:hypothetical protein
MMIIINILSYGSREKVEAELGWVLHSHHHQHLSQKDALSAYAYDQTHPSTF